MIITDTKIEGAYIIVPEKLEDERGFFARTWCHKEVAAKGIDVNFVQVNISFNKEAGTLRGMHYQNAPYQEDKLVRVTKGKIFDVILDLRRDSPSYKQWIGEELSDSNYKMLYIPKGVAHGFMTLADNTEVLYMHTEYFTPGYGTGVAWNDPEFSIQWPEIDNLIITDKDKSWPRHTEED